MFWLLFTDELAKLQFPNPLQRHVSSITDIDPGLIFPIFKLYLESGSSVWAALREKIPNVLSRCHTAPDFLVFFYEAPCQWGALPDSHLQTGMAYCEQGQNTKRRPGPAPVLLLVWKQLRTLRTFSHNAAQSDNPSKPEHIKREAWPRIEYLRLDPYAAFMMETSAIVRAE